MPGVACGPAHGATADAVGCWLLAVLVCRPAPVMDGGKGIRGSTVEGGHPKRLETRVLPQTSRCLTQGLTTNSTYDRCRQGRHWFLIQFKSCDGSIMVHRMRHGFLWEVGHWIRIPSALLLISRLRPPHRGSSPRVNEWPVQTRPVSRLSLRTTPAGSICRDCWPGRHLETGRKAALQRGE
jgi:hypothetical protein